MPLLLLPQEWDYLNSAICLARRTNVRLKQRDLIDVGLLPTDLLTGNGRRVLLVKVERRSGVSLRPAFFSAHRIYEVFSSYPVKTYRPLPFG